MQIKLRKMQEGDRELFKTWLYKPYILKWYKEPEVWLDEIANKDHQYDWISHLIVEVAGKPIGFCQYYDYALGGEDWHHEAEIDGAYSVDYMVGEEAYLGKGYGTALVLALEEEIREKTQAKQIIVQPEPENAVSRKTLLSAGYCYDAKNDLYYKQL